MLLDNEEHSVVFNGHYLPTLLLTPRMAAENEQDMLFCCTFLGFGETDCLWINATLFFLFQPERDERRSIQKAVLGLIHM